MNKLSLAAVAVAAATLAALPALADTTTPATPTTATHHAAKTKHHAKLAKNKTGHTKTSHTAKDPAKKPE
jgi:hypothetical protein